MGELQPAADLLPVVYAELKRLAAYRMANESGPQTLQATALVHEAYLRVTQSGQDPRWENRRHFFCAAAEAMRRILIDRARARRRIKRGGEWEHTVFDESALAAAMPDERLLALDEILDQFAEVDPAAAELVKCRYFIGMTLEEVAEFMGISLSSAKRQWTYARAWLKRELSESDRGGTEAEAPDPADQ